jgi:endonuclease/exonuclease/phosphatase (EEP) superfamily protein YafD
MVYSLESTIQPGPDPAPRLTGAPDRSRILFACGALLLLGAAGPAALGFLARWSVLAEITTHFRVLYAVSALAALVTFWAGRRWRWALASAVVLAWLAGGIVPWYFPAQGPAAAQGPAVKIFTVNVNEDNSNYDALLALIRREQPDLVFIQELSPGWSAALETLRNTYPFYVMTARNDFFGLGVFSRYPLENVDSGDPLNGDVPLIRADLVLGDRRVRVLNVHLAPPEGGWYTELRYKQYPWLTEYAASYSGLLLVAGDFNCTMWSPLYRDLVRRAGLLNARQGHGVLPSWFPLAGPLHLIPIDQILAGGGVRFTNAHLGTRIGSDHRPLIAELRLPR